MPSPRIALLSCFLLAACASNGGPRLAPVDPHAIAASTSLPGSATAAWPGEGWWRGYGDAQLDALITEGLAASPDVAMADARLRRAAGMAQAEGGALLPSVGVDGGATLSKTSYNNGFPKAFVPKGWQDSGQLAGALSFDIDLWGRNRAALAAATSEREAATIDAAQARLLLAGAIAAAYADLARLFDEREVREAAVAMRTKSEDLVRRRVAAGLDSRASLSMAEAQSASARGDLAATDEALGLRRNQIAALIGAGPDRGLALSRPAWPAIAPQGLPADVTTELVARRPDVAAARARVDAALSRVKVAKAAFYPSIRLSALFGVQSLGLDTLFTKDSQTGNVGPAFSLPLFSGGALQGQYRAAGGGADEAIAAYDRTVLGAYRETADAVTSQRQLAERLAEARAALAGAQDAHALARRRYEAGLSSYLDVLAIEDRVLLARLSASALEAANRNADIALIRALGGGYAPRPSKGTAQ